MFCFKIGSVSSTSTHLRLKEKFASFLTGELFNGLKESLLEFEDCFPKRGFRLLPVADKVPGRGVEVAGLLFFRNAKVDCRFTADCGWRLNAGFKEPKTPLS